MSKANVPRVLFATRDVRIVLVSTPCDATNDDLLRSCIAVEVPKLNDRSSRMVDAMMQYTWERTDLMSSAPFVALAIEIARREFAAVPGLRSAS